jgi:hypothetical protein
MLLILLNMCTVTHTNTRVINWWVCERLDDITDAYDHALHARLPWARYPVGWSARYAHIPTS